MERFRTATPGRETEGQDMLEAVLRHSPTPTCLIRGRDLSVHYLNPACKTIINGKGARGTPVSEIWPGSIRHFTNICRHVLETGEPFHASDGLGVAGAVPHEDLQPLFFIWSLRKVRITGEGSGLLLIFWETAHQIPADLALIESEERYRATFEDAPVGIAHVGVDGRWLRFNQAVCAITGYSPQELEKLTFAEITHRDDLRAELVRARDLLAGKASVVSD